MPSLDESAWSTFRVDSLNAKHRGAPSEIEISDRFNALLKGGNVYALRALREARMADPSEFIPPNRIWKLAEIHELTDVKRPKQTGPAGTDNFGLWRNDRGDSVK
jgi:hypothetical protein